MCHSNASCWASDWVFVLILCDCCKTCSATEEELMEVIDIVNEVWFVDENRDHSLTDCKYSACLKSHLVKGKMPTSE